MRQTGKIGIVGGGQLARMLTQAATNLGLSIAVIDPNPNCSASQVGAEQIEAKFDDPEALKKLSNLCEIITIDVEHVDTNILQQFADAGNVVLPLPSTVAMIQDKYLQKLFLSEAGVPLADFTAIEDETDAVAALKKFGGKMLIKTRRGAYDGRGNIVVSNEQELKDALEKFSGQALYAEEFVPFIKELAVMVARDTSGNTAKYPIVETIQKRNICEFVLAPARITDNELQNAQAVADATVEHLKGAGIFGIEMFLTKDGKVLVNEIAPRVHNSGHYTIEGCHTSQFEQHLRAITDMELGNTSLKVPAAVMVNILGKRDGATNLSGIDKLEQNPHTYVHLYGKSPTKVDRKMGHITITSNSVEEAYKLAVEAIDSINI